MSPYPGGSSGNSPLVLPKTQPSLSTSEMRGDFSESATSAEPDRSVDPSDSGKQMTELPQAQAGFHRPSVHTQKGSQKGSVLDIAYSPPSLLRRYKRWFKKGSVLDIVYSPPSFLRRYKRWFR